MSDIGDGMRFAVMIAFWGAVTAAAVLGGIAVWLALHGLT